MNIEFSHEDLTLLECVLAKEESESSIEIHHCRSHDYKEYLKKYNEHVRGLLTRIRNAMQALPRS